MLSSNKNTFKNLAGFTFIELMVVISIVSIMMTVMLLGRDKLSNQLNLKNQAFNLAGYIRQAQAYSLGVKADSTGNFNVSYGVVLTMCPASDSGRYFTFIDVNRDGKTAFSGSPPVPVEPGQTLDFLQGYKINRFYVNGSSPNNCGSGPMGADGKPTRAYLTFLRPSPEARFYYEDKNGVQIVPTTPVPLCFELQNGSTNEKMAIKIDKTGQVSVQSTCP